MVAMMETRTKPEKKIKQGEIGKETSRTSAGMSQSQNPKGGKEIIDLGVQQAIWAQGHLNTEVYCSNVDGRTCAHNATSLPTKPTSRKCKEPGSAIAYGMPTSLKLTRLRRLSETTAAPEIGIGRRNLLVLDVAKKTHGGDLTSAMRRNQ